MRLRLFSIKGDCAYGLLEEENETLIIQAFKEPSKQDVEAFFGNLPSVSISSIQEVREKDIRNSRNRFYYMEK